MKKITKKTNEVNYVGMYKNYIDHFDIVSWYFLDLNQMK